MSTNDSQSPTRDKELSEKSAELRSYSKVLLQESQRLCHSCRNLRAKNKLLVANNVNPNAARKLRALVNSALKATSLPKVCFSIDVPLPRSRQKSVVVNPLNKKRA